jgi:hypothetical protein
VSSISCGLARPRGLIGEKPNQVAVSHGPGIEPYRCSEAGGVGPRQHFEFMGQFRKKEALFSLSNEIFGVEIDLIRNFMDDQWVHATNLKFLVRSILLVRTGI